MRAALRRELATDAALQASPCSRRTRTTRQTTRREEADRKRRTKRNDDTLLGASLRLHVVHCSGYLAWNTVVLRSAMSARYSRTQASRCSGTCLNA